MTLAELNIGAVVPEILVSAMACLILLVELITKPHKPCALAWPLTAVSLLVASYLSLEQFAGVKFEIGFLIDSLTAVMMVVVTFVSLMVHIYTIGYMSDDPGYTRFCLGCLETFYLLKALNIKRLTM